MLLFVVSVDYTHIHIHNITFITLRLQADKRTTTPDKIMKLNGSEFFIGRALQWVEPIGFGPIRFTLNSADWLFCGSQIETGCNVMMMIIMVIVIVSRPLTPDL